MRRLVLTAVTSALVMAVVPASALARHHHHKRQHKRVHHARVIHRRFGDVSTTPTVPGSPPADAVGTVDSFMGGVLTIKLNDGSSVSGKVTSDTEVECEAAQSPTMHDDGDGGGGGGDDQSGDESGNGDHNASGGDDNAGGGDDNGQGDDENAQNCTMANLSHGAFVRGAELRISSAGAVWDKVDLIH